MKMLTPQEAAALLARFGMTAWKIRHGVQLGIYPAMYIGRRMLVDVDKLTEILEADVEGQKLVGMIGTAALSEATGLTVNAIRCGTQAGWLPYHDFGRHHRYDLEEVKRAIERRMEETSASRRKP